MLGEWKKKGSYGTWKTLGKSAKNFMDSLRRSALARKAKMAKSDCRRKCLNILQNLVGYNWARMTCNILQHSRVTEETNIQGDAVPVT